MKPITRIIIAVAAALVVLLAITSTALAATPESPAASAAIPWMLIASVGALALSEILGLVPGWKSNSIVQLLRNLISAVFGPVK